MGACEEDFETRCRRATERSFARRPPLILFFWVPRGQKRSSAAATQPQLGKHAIWPTIAKRGPSTPPWGACEESRPPPPEQIRSVGSFAGRSPKVNAKARRRFGEECSRSSRPPPPTSRERRRASCQPLLVISKQRGGKGKDRRAALLPAAISLLLSLIYDTGRGAARLSRKTANHHLFANAAALLSSAGLIKTLHFLRLLLLLCENVQGWVMALGKKDPKRD